MAKPTTYLAGPIQDAKDSGVKWREKLTPKLLELGIEVLDPTQAEANLVKGDIEQSKETIEGYVASGHWEKFDAHMDRIIDNDIRCVRQSDFIIAYIDTDAKMGGTICEIWEAIEHAKVPVYAVCYDPKKDWNVWLLRTVRRNGQVFESWAQLLEFLEEQHGTQARKE